MTSPATVHLLCGPTGAGKTTYARTLAQAEGAIRFSIDEWMSALFWMDAGHPFEPAWAMERVLRCAALIWRTAMDVCLGGAPCVLEIGLTTAEARARYAGLAREAGLPVRLHLVDAPAEVRWERVQGRNAKAGEAGQLPFELTREMFDFVEILWEPPTDAELAACDGVRIAT
ncbi:MAG TPA: ATP-binding protein [Caulobacteraceae bacterium]